MAIVCEPTTPTKLNSVALTATNEEEDSMYNRQSEESSSSEDDEDSLTLQHEQSHGTKSSQMTSSDTASVIQTTSEKDLAHFDLATETSSTNFIWTTSYQANDTCEDRYASLTGIELLHGDNDKETDSDPMASSTVIRMGLFGVFDGHGGSIVAEFAASRLLPMLKNNIAKALGCYLSHDGTFCVNGKTIARSSIETATATICPQVNSDDEESTSSGLESDEEFETSKQENWYQAPDPLPSSTTNHSLVSPGKHTPLEREIINRTIQETFIQLDEMWINAIDVKKRQNTLYHSGTWNAGSCALVNIFLQREESGKRGPGILYSAHTGDCRGVLFSAKEKGEEDFKDHDIEDVVGSDQNSSNYDHSSCSSSDDDQEISDIQSGSNKHVFIDLNGTNENQSAVKRRRLSTMDGNNQDFNYAVASVSASSESHDEELARIDTSILMPTTLFSTTLTKDHTPYNNKEASLVRERCNYAPRAISSSTSGGIQRVAGSLSVTRALGDAYLKTPVLSFPPYREHAPYISALPEVSSRILTNDDRLIVLGSDGLWEKTDERKVCQWMGTYFAFKNKEKQDRFAAKKLSILHIPQRSPRNSKSPVSVTTPSPSENVKKPGSSGKRPSKRTLPTRKCHIELEEERIQERILGKATVSDMLVYKILNRVRQKQRAPSVRAIMGVPRGHSRRCKHDDITVMVVDLHGFM
jgi:serine/threonine protein phosphatase PrpC